MQQRSTGSESQMALSEACSLSHFELDGFGELVHEFMFKKKGTRVLSLHCQTWTCWSPAIQRNPCGMTPDTPVSSWALPRKNLVSTFTSPSAILQHRPRNRELVATSVAGLRFLQKHSLCGTLLKARSEYERWLRVRNSWCNSQVEKEGFVFDLCLQGLATQLCCRNLSQM